jgi:hypothetical protein
LENINGYLELRFTRGDETFIPMGQSGLTNVSVGEYAYVDAGNDIKNSRFTGAVGPDQTPDLAGVNLKIIIVNGSQPAEVVRHFVNLQQRHYLPHT